MDLHSDYTDNIFSTEKTINFADCNSQYDIRISSLLKYMIEVANIHYRYIGIPHSKLYQAKQIFVLSKIKFKICELPKDGQLIKIKTWERECQPIYFVRDYEVESNEKTIVSAVSDWLVINPDTRMIIRTSNYNAGPYNLAEKDVDCDHSEKIKRDLEGYEKIGVKKVYRSDCDPNHHLHSGNYLDFIFDLFDFEKIKRFPMEISINYISEVACDKEVEIYHKEENDEHLFAGITDEKINFMVKIE